MNRFWLNRTVSFGVSLSLAGSSVFAAGCSPTDAVSPELFTGTLLGTAAGTSIGALFAHENGDTAQNLLVNGAIGAGVGLLAGALMQERNVKLAQEKEVVAREARVLDENQKEIDQLRQRVYDSSSWGRNETKSFDKRYLTEESEAPYQGNPNYY